MYVVELQNPPAPKRAALALSRRPGLAWLDGHAGFGELGRWSFVGCEPVTTVRTPFQEADPHHGLARLNDSLQVAHDGAAVEVAQGGAGVPCLAQMPAWIGVLAYDAAWATGAYGTSRHARNPDSPIAWWGRYDALLATDHETQRAYLAGDDVAACERLRAKLNTGRGPGAPRASAGPATATSPQDHARSIRRALQEIRDGNVYEINLARRWHASLKGEPLALFLAMREQSPVPLGLYLDAGSFQVLGRSMERFLRWDGPGGRLETRPIKGTIARSGSDADEAVALMANEKEQAEHVMVVDLMRNDLGRLAVPGSVRVESLMQVEPYRGLSHLVSRIACRTSADLRLPELLSSCFPPGSVTGAPKRRVVQLIEALEPLPRGVYTGALGFVDRAGGASLAVAIRTAVATNSGVHYWAGGGIVAASDVVREVEETELKARVFVDALEALRCQS